MIGRKENILDDWDVFVEDRLGNYSLEELQTLLTKLQRTAVLPTTCGAMAMGKAIARGHIQTLLVEIFSRKG